MYVADRIDRTNDLHVLCDVKWQRLYCILAEIFFHQTFITPHSLTFHNTFFFFFVFPGYCTVQEIIVLRTLQIHNFQIQLILQQ